MSEQTDSPVRVALAGAHGHGRWHARNLHRLRLTGLVEVVGVCDPTPADAELVELVGDVPVESRLEDLLGRVQPDVTVICTPIHTHLDLTLQAVAAGSHVLLEKPPVPTLADFDRLLAGVDASGRACQLGFQSLGSAAVPEVRRIVASGEVGEVRGIGVAGAWQRDTAYFTRSSWSGRRRVGGAPVVDGALTNPFAHAVITALAVDGSLARGDLQDIEVELLRGNDIEADDTSSLRLRTSRGTTITVAVTLCAESSGDPYVVVHGSRGRVTLFYKEGRVVVATAEGRRSSTHPETDLLEDLVAHVHDPSHPLLVPPSATGSFMEVVEAVRLAPDPPRLAAEHRLLVPTGGAPRVVVPGVDDAVARSAEELALFSELDLPWARPLAVDGAGASR